MELVYTVTKTHRTFRRDWSFREEVPLIALSSRNTLALCTSADLDDDISNSGEPLERSIVEMNYQVYVCDVDKPWNVHKLMTSCDRVVSLEWHVSGLKLLVATAHGICYVYQMKDFLLNCWYDPPCIANIKGEDIIVASWLSPGCQMSFCGDKKDASLYSEKLIKSRAAPSLSRYGGKPVEGLLAITSTGMAVVTLPWKSGCGSDVTIHMETLNAARTRVSVADIAFTSNGDILAATSDGGVSSAIQCHRITLRREIDGSCDISCRSATGFYARCHLDAATRESTTARVTHVKYMQRDGGGDMLIIGAGDVNGSSVELWNLTNQPISVHKVYQPAAPAAGATSAGTNGSGGASSIARSNSVTGHFAQKWVHHSTISYTSLPMSIAVPCFPVTYGYGAGFQADSTLFQYIAVAYKDGSVKLVNKQSFLPMTTTNLDTGITDLDNPDKRRKRVAYMTYMQQSFTGCVLVGIDQYSCVYVMKVVNTRDPVTQVPAQYLVGMLEYLLMTGFDWWDCLATIKSDMVENVMQKLNDNFTKQPTVIQDSLYCRFMALKAALCRTNAAGQIRAADCHCRILLHSISTFFKSSLRPKMLSAGDMSPSDRLSMSCGTNTDLDIDTVVMSLSPEKKFVIDGLTLQSMQPLIQWVADLALYLVAALASLHGGGGTLGMVQFPGATLLQDFRTLGTLRELLVITRTWGLITTSCLPRFTALSAGVDCLAQLFRLLTKVWIVAREGGQTFEDSLVEECCLLISQLSLPPVDEGLFGDTGYSLSLFSQNFPVKYVYCERPSHSYAPPSGSSRAGSLFPLPAGLSVSHHRKDVVRQIALGSEPCDDSTRVCLRCGCHSLLSSLTKASTAKAWELSVKAWELRFERACVCGGQWKLERVDRTPV